jgi:hypothetical protein
MKSGAQIKLQPLPCSFVGSEMSRINRLFTKSAPYRRDELGFLDLGRTPGLVHFEEIIKESVAWVLGPPWLGKSYVANKVYTWLLTEPESSGGAENRVWLTQLDTSETHSILPTWWHEWSKDDKCLPAIWLVDGVDEGLASRGCPHELLLRTIETVSTNHLRELRLVLFSRPYGELADFRGRIQRRYSEIYRYSEPPEFWLAPLDGHAAEQLVGANVFPHASDVIQRNGLQTVAGLPIVLRFLARYQVTAKLGISEVWRGVLLTLLGEGHANVLASFRTDINDRFHAACRIAAVLTLTHSDRIRDYSPDPAAATICMLFQSPSNPLLLAAEEACKTAAFIAMPEQGTFRFSQRNVQDWLTAFALEGLPIPALKSSLAGPDGHLSARLLEPARLIRKITDRPEVRSLIDGLTDGIQLPSDAAEPILAEALRCLDQLEELAQNSPWGLQLGPEQQNELARLRVDGLGLVLAERLRDPGRSYHVKALLIRVAEATESLEAVDSAVEVVLDETQHDELRYGAMWFVRRFGGPAHLRILESRVAERSGNREIHNRVRGVLLAEFLEQNYWPPWRVALNAPAEHPDLADSRGMLLHQLPDRLTIEDARKLLPHLQTLFVRHANDNHPGRLPRLLERIMQLVTEGSPPDPEDIEQLSRFAIGLLGDELGWSKARHVAFCLRPFVAARQRFYEHDIEMARSGQEGRRIFAGSVLKPDDWRWLQDRALGPWAGIQRVWEDAYSMARAAHLEGEIREPEWQDLRVLIETHAPGLPRRLEQLIRQREQEEEQHEAERREHEKQDPTRLPLAERVTRVLKDTRLSPDDRMRKLGLLCFSGMVGLGAQAVGQWEDLPSDLRGRVLEACRTGLELGEPTPIPRQGPFPGAILGEGGSFSRIALSGEPDRLTEAMVERWLRTALFASMSGEVWPDLIRTCWNLSATLTEAALMETINDHVLRYERPFQLRMIPSECWTSKMDDQVITVLRNDKVPPRTRRELLEVLAGHDPKQTCLVATEWASSPVAPDDADQLRQGGLNLLIVLDPSVAIDLVEPDFGVRGLIALEQLPSLWGWRDEFHVQWEQWPVELLERLGRMLLTALPPSKDPEFQGGFVTQDQELRLLRDRIIGFLLDLSASEAKDALDRLAVFDTKLKTWISTHRASQQAGQLVPKFTPTASRDPGALSVSEAVRVLERTEYRLIRSDDDLIDATIEALNKIDTDVGYDLPMLYEAPKRNGAPRKPLHEDALQAYLRRRLCELLPQVVDGVSVQIIREEQVAFRRRLDIRVIAPCHGTRLLAKVVIEVKWSTNAETRSALVSQLGEQYLRGEQLTHGIFLVGWCGEWAPGDGSGRSTDRQQLEEYLISQRDNYCQPGQDGQFLRIEPLVLDLRWSRKEEHSPSAG